MWKNVASVAGAVVLITLGGTLTYVGAMQRGGNEAWSNADDWQGNRPSGNGGWSNGPRYEAPYEAVDPVKVTFVNEPDNLLVNELWGAWKVDKDLTKAVSNTVPGNDDWQITITFTDTSMGADAIIKAANSFFERAEKAGQGSASRTAEIRRACQNVLLCGALTIDDGHRVEPGSFFLSHWRGHTALYIADRGRLGDMIWVSMARDPKGDNDTLFLTEVHRDGGEGTIALRRVIK
jgi:hypothetical protein